MWLGRCGSENRAQKDMCLQEIGLRPQIMITILDSIVSIIQRVDMTTDLSRRISTLMNHKHSNEVRKVMRQIGLDMI
jgi:hypothetical protein